MNDVTLAAAFQRPFPPGPLLLSLAWPPAFSARPRSQAQLPAAHTALSLGPGFWVRVTSGELQACGAGTLRLCFWLLFCPWGRQRLLGNKQSNALYVAPWVRPTELLGLSSVLPDVTQLLH